MKNLSLKLFAVLFVSLLGYSLQAQDQTFPVGYATAEVYSVDIAENGGTGTTGSTYNWTVTNSDTPPVNVTADLNTSPQGVNTFTINDWGSLPAGMYTLHVVETNATCVGLDMTIQVEIVNVGTPLLTALDPNICSTNDAEFEITGAPALSQVIFTVTGGTPNVTSPVTTDASGNATIIVTHDGTSPQIDVTITDMILADGTPNDFADQTESTTVTIVNTTGINFTP